MYIDEAELGVYLSKVNKVIYLFIFIYLGGGDAQLACVHVLVSSADIIVFKW